MTVTRNFEHFVTFDFNITFLKDGIFFIKGEYHFLVKSTTIYVVPLSLQITQITLIKRKPMVRKTNCGVQTWPITKNVALPLKLTNSMFPLSVLKVYKNTGRVFLMESRFRNVIGKFSAFYNPAENCTMCICIFQKVVLEILITFHWRSRLTVCGFGLLTKFPKGAYENFGKFPGRAL